MVFFGMMMKSITKQFIQEEDLALIYTSSFDTLERLLEEFPQIFFFTQEQNGEIRLTYNIKMCRNIRVTWFEVKSWERSLKHAGFELVQKHPYPMKVWIGRKIQLINVTLD